MIVSVRVPAPAVRALNTSTYHIGHRGIGLNTPPQIDREPVRSRTRAAWACALFAAAYGQGALLSGNQNSYLLHGFAGAGAGTLARDWTAQTTDPFPVFTMLAALMV